MKNIATDAIQDSLNRYLDGDLSGEEAVHVASALATDPALREEMQTLRAVRAAVRNASSRRTDTTAAETTRLRTLSRLRASVETEGWESERAAPVSNNTAQWWLTWRPAFTAFAAFASVVGVYLMIPQAPDSASNLAVAVRSTPGPASTPAAANSVAALPSEDEMSLLLDLHDAHGSAYAGEEPLLHRSRVAEAQASLLRRADDAVAQHL